MDEKVTKNQSQQARTALDLMSQVLADSKLDPGEKKDLLDEIRKARPALEDRWIYRWVIYFLGATVVLTVLGSFMLLMGTGKPEVPDGVIALGSAAIGALAGLLAKHPESGDDGDA